MITALRPPSRYELRVDAYDRVSTALTATLILLGAGVLLMFGFWLTWALSSVKGPLNSALGLRRQADRLLRSPRWRSRVRRNVSC